MRVAIFGAKKYEETLLEQLNTKHGHELEYFEVPLDPHTVRLAAGFPAISVFVNDRVDREVMRALSLGERSSSRPVPRGLTI